MDLGKICMKFAKFFDQHWALIPWGNNIYQLFDLKNPAWDFWLHFCFLRYFRHYVLVSKKVGTKNSETLS